MNKISLAFALVFFIALSFTGCKSTKKVGTVEAGGAKAHNEFFTLMQEQAFKYETLTARLNVDLNLPGNNMSSRVDLQALFTNRLFLPGQQGISPKLYNRFKLKQDGPAAEIQVKDVMGLLYTFMADGEEKILSTCISEPSDRYALQWDYADFRLADGQPFPMRMDVQVMKDGTSQGGVTLHFSRMQTDVPVKMDFSIPAKYKRITLSQIIKSLSINKM